MVLDAAIRTVREQITDRLRDDILTGRLAEGERLQEAKLAERFGVSRGPIREVLAQLTHEGLVEAKPNCGVKVTHSESEAIRELIVPIRRVIETFALKTFFAEISERDVLAWETILHHLKSACERKDQAAIIQYDLAFHRSLLTRAGVPALVTIWQTIVARIRRHFRHATARYGENLLKIYEEHRRLVEVFRSGNRDAAIKALEKHIW
ncbi:MAG TPA: GntR family transcriptional regulator [Gemmataceae bacterium]|nr:GntR family transcriptional regulator [Gemmataceae bacterium]